MEAKKQVIYLDHNATTQIDKRFLDAMMPFLTHEFANANSTHQFGVTNKKALKSALLKNYFISFQRYFCRKTQYQKGNGYCY